MEERKKNYSTREKIIDLEKNRRIIRKSEIDELNDRIQNLTQAMEVSKCFISVT